MLLGDMKSYVFKSIPSVLKSSPQALKPIVSKVGDYTPVVGTTFSFVKTAKKVYKCTSPIEAISVGVKSIVIDCTPPTTKYPVLCGALLVCAVATFYTGNPNLACGAVKCAEIIVEDVTGG